MEEEEPDIDNSKETGHVLDNRLRFPACSVCGLVKSRKGWSRKCKGPTKLRKLETIRSE